MTKFITLSSVDIWNLINDEPVEVYINQIRHILCTEKYYKDMWGKSTGMMDELEKSKSDLTVINNKLKDLSERIENIEKQMKEEKEEQLKQIKKEEEEQLKQKEEQIKKLRAELDYAKFCYNQPERTNKYYF